MKKHFFLFFLSILSSCKIKASLQLSDGGKALLVGGAVGLLYAAATRHEKADPTQDQYASLNRLSNEIIILDNSIWDKNNYVQNQSHFEWVEVMNAYGLRELRQREYVERVAVKRSPEERAQNAPAIAAIEDQKNDVYRKINAVKTEIAATHNPKEGTPWADFFIPTIVTAAITRAGLLFAEHNTFSTPFIFGCLFGATATAATHIYRARNLNQTPTYSVFDTIAWRAFGRTTTTFLGAGLGGVIISSMISRS